MDAVNNIVPSVSFEIVSPLPNVISFPVTVKSPATVILELVFTVDAVNNIVPLVFKIKLSLPLSIPLIWSSPLAIVKFPVEVPVAVVVPKINFPAELSHPIKALSPDKPRSIIIPLSPVSVVVNPLLNSIILSSIVVLVDLILVVADPVIARLPFIVKLPFLSTVKSPLPSASVIFKLVSKVNSISPPLILLLVLSVKTKFFLILTSSLDKCKK